MKMIDWDKLKRDVESDFANGVSPSDKADYIMTKIRADAGADRSEQREPDSAGWETYKWILSWGKDRTYLVDLPDLEPGAQSDLAIPIPGVGTYFVRVSSTNWDVFGSHYQPPTCPKDLLRLGKLLKKEKLPLLVVVDSCSLWLTMKTLDQPLPIFRSGMVVTYAPEGNETFTFVGSKSWRYGDEVTVVGTMMAGMTGTVIGNGDRGEYTVRLTQAADGTELNPRINFHVDNLNLVTPTQFREAGRVNQERKYNKVDPKKHIKSDTYNLHQYFWIDGVLSVNPADDTLRMVDGDDRYPYCRVVGAYITDLFTSEQVLAVPKSV